MTVHQQIVAAIQAGEPQPGLHESLIGQSSSIAEVNDLIERLALSDLTVLITGETGTGKDITARLLHQNSRRYGRPFIKVNCPAIPDHIFESELFGYEQGAFTGAHHAKPGRLELANEGTLFLDEITETSLALQGKLLQILDGEPIVRIGGVTPVKSDVRIIAATNVPIDKAIASGKLRKDAAFRLNEVVIHLPPLQKRREDIPLIAENLNANISKQFQKAYTPIAEDIMAVMMDMSWPGNVRELSLRIKKFVTTGNQESLLEEDGHHAARVEIVRSSANVQEPPPDFVRAMTEPPPTEVPRFMPLKQAATIAAEQAEKKLIQEALRYTRWNRKRAAKLLDTSYSSLLRRIEQYNIDNT